MRASSSPLKKSRRGRNHRMFPQNPRLRGKGTIKIRLRHLYTEFGMVSISFAHYTSLEDFILYISDFYCVTPAVYFMKSVPLLCDKWRKSGSDFPHDMPEVFSFPVSLTDTFTSDHSLLKLLELLVPPKYTVPFFLFAQAPPSKKNSSLACCSPSYWWVDSPV